MSGATAAREPRGRRTGEATRGLDRSRCEPAVRRDRHHHPEHRCDSRSGRDRGDRALALADVRCSHGRVGKELFRRRCAGHTELVWDGGGLVDCAVVATLGQETLVAELKRFDEAVAWIKTEARAPVGPRCGRDRERTG